MDIDMTKEHFNPNRPIVRFVEHWKSLDSLSTWKFLKTVLKMELFEIAIEFLSSDKIWKFSKN